jgi:hypothetical protein
LHGSVSSSTESLSPGWHGNLYCQFSDTHPVTPCQPAPVLQGQQTQSPRNRVPAGRTCPPIPPYAFSTRAGGCWALCSAFNVGPPLGMSHLNMHQAASFSVSKLDTSRCLCFQNQVGTTGDEAAHTYTTLHRQAPIMRSHSQLIYHIVRLTVHTLTPVQVGESRGDGHTCCYCCCCCWWWFPLRPLVCLLAA